MSRLIERRGRQQWAMMTSFASLPSIYWRKRQVTPEKAQTQAKLLSSYSRTQLGLDTDGVAGDSLKGFSGFWRSWEI